MKKNLLLFLLIMMLLSFRQNLMWNILSWWMLKESLDVQFIQELLIKKLSL